MYLKTILIAFRLHYEKSNIIHVYDSNDTNGTQRVLYIIICNWTIYRIASALSQPQP